MTRPPDMRPIRDSVAPTDVSTGWIKLLLQRNPVVHQIAMYWRSRSTASCRVQRNRSKIVIEAFPRTANSFSVRLFREANPQIHPSEIVHHTHSIHTVKRAARWHIPVLVIVRDPVEAVSSVLVATGNVAPAMMSLYLTRYLDFYSPLGGRGDRVVLARFEDVVGGAFRSVLSRINERFGTRFHTEFDEVKLARAVKAGVREDSPNRASPERIPLPNEPRSRVLEEVKPRVAKHPKLGRARDVYARTVALAEGR